VGEAARWSWREEEDVGEGIPPSRSTIGTHAYTEKEGAAASGEKGAAAAHGRWRGSGGEGVPRPKESTTETARDSGLDRGRDGATTAASTVARNDVATAASAAIDGRFWYT
jgi:hypothetical protein